MPERETRISVRRAPHRMARDAEGENACLLIYCIFLASVASGNDRAPLECLEIMLELGLHRDTVARSLVVAELCPGDTVI